MILDKTHIVIRERGFAEIMDLALKVIRRHLGPLTLAALAGVVPWALLNGFLLNHLVDDLDIWDYSAGFMYAMVLFIAVQTPLAVGFITLYLGQVTFLEETDPRRMIRDYVGSLPQLLFHTLFRAIMAATFIGLAIPYSSRPYTTELILLERNPMFTKKGGGTSTRSRSRSLHKFSGGDSFSHWIAALGAGSLLVLGLTMGIPAAVQMIFAIDTSYRQMLVYLFPAAMWTATCFFAVVRFLAYLDLRTRREGWEVELKMRSEAARLARSMA